MDDEQHEAPQWARGLDYAGSLVGVTGETVRSWLRQGRLPTASQEAGGTWLIEVRELFRAAGVPLIMDDVRHLKEQVAHLLEREGAIVPLTERLRRAERAIAALMKYAQLDDAGVEQLLAEEVSPVAQDVLTSVHGVGRMMERHGLGLNTTRYLMNLARERGATPPLGQPRPAIIAFLRAELERTRIKDVVTQCRYAECDCHLLPDLPPAAAPERGDGQRETP